VLGQTAQETAPLKEDTWHSKGKETERRRRGRLGTREENMKRLRRVPKIPTPSYKSGEERALELTS